MPQPTNLTDLTVANGEPLVWGRRTYVMGIINLTPDSFSGDGLGPALDSQAGAAVHLGLGFQQAGADFLDLGAESTRPGNRPITAETELDRLLPALKALVGKVDIPISVDTYKSQVAQAALAAGATLVNDVWGLKKDPRLAKVAAKAGAPLVLTHNQKGTRYGDLLADILTSLGSSARAALEAGVAQENIILDPGIGFGKTPDHNLEILGRLKEFDALGYPLLVGTSRKSTIGLVLNQPPDQRLEGTAATVALAIAGGADIVRVHDVKEMVQVCRMTDAVIRGWRPPGWDR